MLLELDKIRSGPQVAFGPSSSGGGVPPELSSLATAHNNTNKLILPSKSAIGSATQEYEKLTDPSNPVPSAPVHAARLNGLLKKLATAEGAVAECVKARKELVTALETLLTTHRTALAEDEEHLSELLTRKVEIEDKKQEVELSIMRGLGPPDGESSTAESTDSGAAIEPDRPEIEALTPPAMDDEPLSPASYVPLTVESGPAATSSVESQSNVASHYPPVGTNWSNKRRRVDDDFPDLEGDDGIDADVAEMLRKESPVS